MELVTIIVAVYNVRNYLKECLLSLVKQDYKNIEILIINDGSYDGSQKIINKFAAKYSNITAYKKENGGVSSSRNLGLKHANGKYILFVDGDDMIRVDMVRNLVNTIEREKTDLACSNYFYLYKNRTQKASFPKENNISSDEAKSLLFLEDSLKGVVWNKLYKKSIIDKYNLTFDENIKIGEDIVFTISYLNKIKEVSLVNRPLYFYRMRKSSALNYQNEKDLSIFEAINQVYKIDTKMEKKMEEYYATMYFKYYKLLKETGKIKEVKELSFIKTMVNTKISLKNKSYIAAYRILPQSIKLYVKNRRKNKDNFFE